MRSTRLAATVPHIAACLLLGLLWLSPTVAQEEAPHVLLINSYHPQYKWTHDLTNGVRDELADFMPEENLHVEYLDGRRMVDDPVYFAILHTLFNYKYHEFKPNLVITSDDYALNFMLHEGDVLFPNIPVVFNGVNVFEPSLLYGHSNYTGILEGMEIEGNLDLIVKIQPAVHRIVMLADQTSFGTRMTTQAREIITKRAAQHWQPNIKLEVWDDFTIDELFTRAQTLDQHTAFLMLAIHKDRTGQYFSFAEQLPKFTSTTQAPVYGMWGALLIGHGVIGGMMNDPYQHGRAAAQIAKRILTGTDIHRIPIEPKAQYTPHFDFKVLKRFDIDESLLPEQNTIHFRPDNFFERNRSIALNALWVLTALIVIIVILMLNIRRRKRAETDLRQLNEHLEQRVQERTDALAHKAEELEHVNATMERLAYTDLLTELPNRRAGQELLQHLFERAQWNKEPLSIAMIDVDHFKQVNDRFGHEQGDDILRLCAQRSRSTLRAQDRLCRWGGEEFLLLLPGALLEAATLAGERLRGAVSAAPMPPAGIITVSVGIATARPSETLHNLLDRADIALYNAKESGRNCVRVSETLNG